MTLMAINKNRKGFYFFILPIFWLISAIFLFVNFALAQDIDCPPDSPIYYQGGCYACLDFDGGVDKSEASTMTYYDPAAGEVVTQYDKCVNGRRLPLVEYSCGDYPDKVYSRRACGRGSVCIAGSCRPVCRWGRDCIGGYRMEELGGLFTWMEAVGYDQDFIDVYRDSARKQPEWARSWTRDMVLNGNPFQNDVLNAFREKDHVEVNVRVVRDEGAVLDGRGWYDSDSNALEAKLNSVLGRHDFFDVERHVESMDYDQIFSCPECGIETVQLPGPAVYPAPYQHEYGSIVKYHGPGLDHLVNGSGEECRDNGYNVYLFISLFDDQNRKIEFDSAGCFGREGCNAFCTYSPPSNSIRLVHELGHTLGFEHPYDADGFIMGPDSLMVQSYPRYYLGLAELFSPLEMYLLEPGSGAGDSKKSALGSGFEDLDSVVAKYNQKAVIRRYFLINENDYWD